MKKIQFTLLLWCCVSAMVAYAQGQGNTQMKFFWETGEKLYKKGLYNDAIRAYNDGIKLKGNFLLFNSRAMAYEKLGKFTEAIADYQKAYEVVPEPLKSEYEPTFHFNIGNAYIGLNNYKNAVKHYTQHLNLSRKSVQGYLNRAIAYEFGKDFDRALADYDKAEALEPNNALVLLRKGTIMTGMGKYEDGVAMLSKAIGINPKMKEAYLSRAEARVNESKFQDALPDYDRFLELDNKSIDGYEARASVKVALNLHDQALADYQKILNLDATHEGALRNCVKVYQLQEKTNEALQYAEKLVKAKPQQANYWYEKAMLHKKIGNKTEAANDFGKAAALDKKNDNYISQYALALKNIDKFQEALVQYNQAIALNAKDADYFNNRGVVKIKLAKYADAIEDFEKALKIEPNFGYAYNNRGFARLNLNKIAEAEADCQKALQLDNKNAYAHYYLGLIRQKTSKFAEAEAAFNKALALQPNNAAFLEAVNKLKNEK